MSCADKIPSYAEFQALKNEVASLKECCKNSGANDPNFAKKVFDALKSDKGGLGVIIGGLLIGGVRVDQFFSPEKLRAAEEVFGLRRKVQNIEQAQQATEQFKRFAEAQLKEKQRLLNLVDQKLGRVANTANSALSKADKVNDIAAGLTDVRRRVGSVQGAINTTARRVDTVANVANTAKNNAFSALGSASKFLGILSAIGGAAGLIALFGYFKAVRPTLAAHERRLDDHDQAFSDVYTSIGRVDGRARSAQTAATAAKNAASDAQRSANQAQRTANRANATANDAIATADRAEATANQANNTANDANQRSRRNETEIEKLKRVKPPMTPADLAELKRQNVTTIQQNNYITNLIQRLPPQFKEPDRIPYELLGIPALIRNQTGEISRAANNAATAARNTSRSNLESAAAAGTCQAFQPDSCGDRAIQRNVAPLKRLLDFLVKRSNEIGAGLSGATLLRVNVAIQKIDALNRTVLDKFAKTWDFLKVDRVLNVLSTAASIHNASMLSFNVIQSLGETMSAMLSIIGLRDAEGNPFSIGTALRNSVQGIINRTLGAEAARGISERWNKLNRIITAGSAVVMAVRSVQWAIAEGVEIIGGWIAHIGNGLRESGTVSDRQYPWMDAGIKIKNFSRLDKWNDGLESAENITNQVYATVSAGQEIAETVGSVRQAKSAFDTEFSTKTTEADTDLTNRETESAAADIDSLDLVRVELEEE